MFSAESIAYEQTASFSRIVNDYLSDAEELRPFYAHRPDLDGIRAAIAARQTFGQERGLLADVLQDQYAVLEASEAVAANIEALRGENTFTITTAHQPNLASGPLYFLYKILHAIKLANWLGHELPGSRFVPLFYMGSEDADLDELDHFTVEGKRYTWKTSQKGAVGRMLIDKQLIALLQELEQQIGVLPHGSEVLQLLRACFTEGRTIQDATFRLVHSLFGRYGLIVLIADEPRLKGVMRAVFEADIFRQEAAGIVAGTSERLQQSYNVQAHPRDINLFYLKNDIRERIEQRGDDFHVVNTDIRFTADEMRRELEQHPVHFSPNVILRGLYQETILPNVAFIGGGGELAYWLQLQDLFRHYQVPFPVLVLRNSFLIVPAKEGERLRKLSIGGPDLFLPVLQLMNRHLERAGAHPKLNGELHEITALYEKLKEAAVGIDTTLGGHVDALRTRVLRQLQALELKMQRAARRRESATQRQIEAFKAKLFPGGGLQERVENFSSFYGAWGPQFIDELLAHSGALDQRFTVLYQKHSAS